MIRLLKRSLLAVSALLAVVVVGASVYVAFAWNRTWDAPLPNLTASRDPEIVKRGEYLVYGSAHCAECHAGSVAEYDAGMTSGRRPPLAGGMPLAMPPFGVIYSANLTPDRTTGIGRYTDAQIARMLRYGVKPDGHTSVVFLMPYGNMADSDIVAILSYLRSQPPVAHLVPDDHWTLLGKAVRAFTPAFKPRTDANPPHDAPGPQPHARGEYLARDVSGCVICHTDRDPLTFAAVRPEFAGGFEMEPVERDGADQTIWFRTPNLTAAPGSALSKFPDRATFIARFRHGGRQHAGSPMPWECFAQMNDEDLGAIYEFLHALSPQRGPTGDPAFKKS